MNFMQINDLVYGPINVTEPVLIELINSKPLQRLKGINNAGASQYAVEGTTISRYDHCVGVMLVLRILGASVEEQIAGLLHDVPHTAFSHVVDFVFPSDDHTFHEKFHETIIKNSEIPEILQKHGFDLNRLLDEHNFPLLERPAPSLCADRVDYTLRDMAGHYGPERSRKYISHFIVVNNEIMIDDALIAKQFAEDYLMMDTNYYSSPFELALYHILAGAIRIGLDKHIISEDDLFGDDAHVYNKLKNSNDKEILAKLALLNPKLKIKLDPNNYDFFAKNKLRYVDPKFLTKDKTISKVSLAFEGFAEKLQQHREARAKGVFIKIIS